jgi:hypothetical protein
MVIGSNRLDSKQCVIITSESLLITWLLNIANKTIHTKKVKMQLFDSQILGYDDRKKINK